MSRRAALAVVAALALAAVMTHPLIARPGSVARFDTNDGKFSVWNVAWVAHALTDASARLFDANIFHPHRGTLAYSEANLVAGVMAVPIYLATRNPVTAHNAVVYAALVLAFLVTWALVCRLTGSAAAGLLAGTAFAFSSFVSAHTAHIQLLMVFVVPLSLLALHRYVERPGTLRGTQLGLALAVAGLSCGYYGIFSGLSVGLGVLWFAAGHPHQLRYWRGVIVAVIVGAAAVAPAVRPYVELRRVSGFKSGVDLDAARTYSADLATYLRSGTIIHQQIRRAYPAWLERDLARDGDVLFPGVVLPMVALVGLVAALRAPGRDRGGGTASSARRVAGFYAVLTVAAGWASLGPDAGLYAWLSDWVPMMSFLRAPARIGVVVLLGLAVLGGFGLAAVGRLAGGRLMAAAIVALTAVELKAVWPLAAVPPVPTVYRYLATLPRGAVLELHFPYHRSDMHNHARYMFWSMWHWQPLVNGYSDFIPPDIYALAVPINAFPDPESFRILKARDVKYVVVHFGTYDEGPIRDSMYARFPQYAEYLRPVADADNSRVYEIVRWPE